MKPYADTTALRTRQVLTDLAALLACLLLAQVGKALHDAVLRLAAPGRQLARAGTDLSGTLSDAGVRLGKVPLAGGGLRAPFDAASAAAGQVAAAGVAQQHAVSDLALALGLVVALLPIAWVLSRWLPGRLRWAREAGAAEQVRSDVDLLALRAAITLPLHRLARLGPEPVAAGDAASRERPRRWPGWR